jgi:hypothetical protein
MCAVRYYVGYKNKSTAYVYEYSKESCVYIQAVCLAGFESQFKYSNDFQCMINMYISIVLSIRRKERVPSIYNVWCVVLRDALDKLIKQCEN